jgi:hypothetical protein
MWDSYTLKPYKLLDLSKNYSKKEKKKGSIDATRLCCKEWKLKDGLSSCYCYTKLNIYLILLVSIAANVGIHENPVYDTAAGGARPDSLVCMAQLKVYEDMVSRTWGPLQGFSLDDRPQLRFSMLVSSPWKLLKLEQLPWNAMYPSHHLQARKDEKALRMEATIEGCIVIAD